MKIEIKSLHELDCYLTNNNDQPETCPKCGLRTEFIEIDDTKQQHKCTDCLYEYFLDIE